MAYWFFDDAMMCRMFPASLGDAALRWFTRLLAGQIDNFWELVEQFRAKFITNIKVVKGLEALRNLKKMKGENLCEYSSRYWETYQETKGCEL